VRRPKHFPYIIGKGIWTLLAETATQYLKVDTQLSYELMCKKTTKQITCRKMGVDFRGHVLKKTQHGNMQPDCFGCIINTSKKHQPGHRRPGKVPITVILPNTFI
jgi:hypothetical protein